MITVIKRDGTKEPLMIEKWQAQVAKVCKGIADVSQSMIEIKAQLHFYDGITTREVDGITLRAIVDLIDVEHNPDVGHTNYQFVAGKQRLSMLRKDVYGSYEPPRLYEIVKRNIAVGLYTPDLLTWYTEDDWNKMDEMIDHEKDELYSYAAIEQLIEKYLVRNRATKEIYETPQVRYMVAAATVFHRKNLNRPVCVTSKSTTTVLQMVCLLLLLLCWLGLALLLNSFLVVCLSAVTTIWIAYLLLVR
jgi:ribonucleoside-diphosphate reductase alpha chain